MKLIHVLIAGTLSFMVTSGVNAACTATSGGTPQSNSFLTGTEFADNQNVGAITPACARDLIASTYGAASNNINLKNLGLPTGGDDSTAINSAIASALPATFTGTGSIALNLVVATNAQTTSGSVLTFTSTLGIVVGQPVTGTNIPASTVVNSIVPNTSVTISNPVSGTVTNGQSITFALSGNAGINGAAILTITGTPGGTIAMNQTISGTNVPPGSRVLAPLSGAGGAGTYLLSIPPAALVTSETITFQPAPTGIVYAPAGVYSHATEIVDNGVCIVGDGPTSTIFRSTDTTGNSQGIQINGVDPCLENLAITSTWNGSRQSNGTSQAIYVNLATGFLIQNVWCVGGAAGCMLNYGGTNGRVINNRAYNTLADAFHNTNTAHDILVLGNYAYAPGDDCFPTIGYTTDVTVPYNIRVEANTCVNSGARGMVVDGGNNIVYVGNIIVTPGSGVCIYAAGDSGYLTTTNVTFAGNTCTFKSTFSNYPVMVFGQSGEITSGVLIDDNQMIGTPSACMLLGEGTMFVTDLTITNNHCTAATGSTIEAVALNGVSNLLFSGNTIKGYASGIRNIANIDTGYIKIGSNVFDGLNPGASGTQAAIWLASDTFAGIDIYDNSQINDGTTITDCLIVTGQTEVTIGGNHCDNHTNSVSGITSGYYNNVYGANTSFGPIVTGGTKFTTSGCAISATVGGATQGTYTSGTAGTCTAVITMNGATGFSGVPTGWTCIAQDQTTPADIQKQTASSPTSATIAGTTASADVVVFQCLPY